MISEDKPMSKQYHGFLITNQYKTEANQPEYFGIITIAGSEYSIGGWLAKTKAGRPKIDLRVRLRKRQSIQDKIEGR